MRLILASRRWDVTFRFVVGHEEDPCAPGGEATGSRGLGEPWPRLEEPTFFQITEHREHPVGFQVSGLPLSPHFLLAPTSCNFTTCAGCQANLDHMLAALHSLWLSRLAAGVPDSDQGVRLYNLDAGPYNDTWGWFSGAAAGGALSAEYDLDPRTCIHKAVL